MSFTDIRRLNAILNELGYPGSCSMDSFRYPNFELVAHCLHWLLLKYDPTVGLDIDISTDGRRINFLKQATQIMLSSARIKLNPRRLYLADGYAVNELLKVASLLQKATKISTTFEYETVELDSSIKAFDVKSTRLLVDTIMKCGAYLCDQIDAEPTLQEYQNQVTMTNTNMDEIEQSLSEATNTMLKSISLAQQDQVKAQKEEEGFHVKLEKQQIELERSKDRLATLSNVRPAYIDKYEALRKDLDELFEAYSKKSRNLQWLQTQMEGHNQEEQEMSDEAACCMRRLQSQLYEEELSILRGEEVDGSVAKARCSEESDGEGTTLWKRFNGNSFETILDPRARSHRQPSHFSIRESSRGLPKGPMQNTSHAKGGLKALTNPMLTPEFSKSAGSCILTCTDDAFKVEEGFEPGATDSETSIDGSNISGVLEEADDIPLDTDGIDPNDNSSDDDF